MTEMRKLNTRGTAQASGNTTDVDLGAFEEIRPACSTLLILGEDATLISAEESADYPKVDGGITMATLETAKGSVVWRLFRFRLWVRMFRLGAVLVAAFIVFIIVVGIVVPFVAWYFGG
jgi:hypothetical protein